MFDGFGPRKEDAIVAGPIVADFHVERLKRYELALFGHARFDHEHFELGIGQLTYAHVAYFEHETQLAVAFAHHGVVREYDGSFAFVGSRYFGKHHAGHQALHEYAKARLQHEK